MSLWRNLIASAFVLFMGTTACACASDDGQEGQKGQEGGGCKCDGCGILDAFGRGYCDDDLVCNDWTNRCHRRGSAGIGESCNAWKDDLCADGLKCVYALAQDGCGYPWCCESVPER
jgi:hypothetical protein